MEKYYGKIRKRSAKGNLVSVLLMLVGAFLLYNYSIGTGMIDKNRYFGILIGVVWLLLGIWAILSGMRDVQKIKEQMAQAGIDEYLLSQDLDQGTDYKNCNVGNRYAVQCRTRPDIIFLDNVLIVYMDVNSTTSKGYTNYSYYVRVVERDGKEKYLTADDDDEMRAIFSEITKKRPYVLTGMDSVMREMKKKNFSEIIRMVDERRNQYESGSV